MAVNNQGAQLDTAGEVAVDFVWGNMAPQPNDARTTRLDLTKGDHINLESGWNGFPSYTPNTAGSDVAGSTDYVQVISVLGKTTADAQDVLGDNGLTVTTAAGATNTAKTVTDIARTSGSTNLVFTATGAGAAYPVGTKVTVSNFSGGDAFLNGTFTVTANATNTFTVKTTETTTVALTGKTGSVIGATGTIKSQSIAGGAAQTAVGAAVTITPWA